MGSQIREVASLRPVWSNEQVQGWPRQVSEIFKHIYIIIMKFPYHRDNASQNSRVSNQKPYARYGFWASDKKVCIDTLNIIVIVIVLSYPLERGNKMLLLKVLHICVTRHGEIIGINLKTSGIHNTQRVCGCYWGRNIAKKLYHTVNPLSCNNNWLGKMSSLLHWCHDYAGNNQPFYDWL